MEDENNSKTLQQFALTKIFPEPLLNHRSCTRAEFRPLHGVVMEKQNARVYEGTA